MSCSPNNSSVKETFSIRCNNQKELLGVLELLNTTNDINLQLRIFSCLSAYIMYKKGADMNIIIKCNVVYDKVRYVLENGLPRKACNALNFLSTLLFVDGAIEETTTKTALAIYARNMTRLSGCLAAMCEMFTASMMYHDTWRSLCQCLSVACTECELNKTYCTHLIPICIQKCSKDNIDLLLVLQSLLMNHARNIKLFIDCNGITIFTRELLHYDKCLHLLTTIVQYSQASAILINQTNVLDILRDFLRLYGPNSQIGQKAVIILKHISSRAKDVIIQNKQVGNIHKREDNLLRNKTEISQLNENKLCSELDDTSTLMQNVIKEIFQYKQSEMKSNLDFPKNINRNISRNMPFPKPVPKSRKNLTYRDIAEDMSFSFINNNEDTIQTISTITQNTQTETNIDPLDFRPAFASTPKHFKNLTAKAKPVFNETQNKLESNKEFIDTISLRNVSLRERKLYDIRQKRNRYKIQKRKEFKKIKNQSLSSRFFSAINDSCTNLVQTMKNIFTKKDESGDTEGNQTADGSFSHSFMDYMKMRDAVIEKQNIDKNVTKFSNETASCKTCDDTQALKRKLVKDEHLRQTIKKLKMGINLYGCDFKKISRTLWPRDSYMTPAVLYNLYRKLILK